MNYPPYNITEKMIDYISKIMEKIGEINSYINLNKKLELRRQNRIKSIHSSLAIENNPLSLEQVTDIINGNLVIGDQRDIQEVKNAYKAYEELDKIEPYSMEEIKRIHGIMTFLTVERSGKFRNHGEGVYDENNKCIFMAPPENMVPELMENLFDWLNKAKESVNPLILSSIFHYELLFIHPFSDGNGRMARLWQTAILSNWKSIFKYIPIENLMKKYQQEYYDVINECNTVGESTKFIEFMLEMFSETLDNLIIEQETTQEITQETTQEKIVNLIKENSSITQAEMAEKLEMTRDGIAYNIKILKENGIIERVGATKNGSWKVNK